MTAKTGTKNGDRWISFRVKNASAKMGKIIDRACLHILTLTGEQELYAGMSMQEKIDRLDLHWKRLLIEYASSSYRNNATDAAVQGVQGTIATEILDHTLDDDE